MDNLIMVTGLEDNVLYGVDLATQERVSATVTPIRTEDWFAAFSEAVQVQKDNPEDSENEPLIMVVTKNEFYKEEA